MARPKRFSEKLVVGLTPEIKEFLQKEAEKECHEMDRKIGSTRRCSYGSK